MSKDFETWYGSLDILPGETKEQMRYAWEAARKDHYRIGEEVEIQYNGGNWHKAIVGVYQGTMYKEEIELNVRRVPEWKPKEGEAVFTYNGTVRVGSVKNVIDNKTVYVYQTENEKTVESFLITAVKPFAADKIGKPWGEI